MTESLIPEEGTGGSETSHDADIDAGFGSGGLSDEAASAAEGADGSTDSHGADIDAGYDDSGSADADENGLDLGR